MPSLVHSCVGVVRAGVGDGRINNHLSRQQLKGRRQQLRSILEKLEPGKLQVTPEAWPYRCG